MERGWAEAQGSPRLPQRVGVLARTLPVTLPLTFTPPLPLSQVPLCELFPYFFPPEKIKEADYARAVAMVG